MLGVLSYPPTAGKKAVGFPLVGVASSNWIPVESSSSYAQAMCMFAIQLLEILPRKSLATAHLIIQPIGALERPATKIAQN